MSGILANKVAIVTGAADGMGKQIALLLLEAGAVVVTCDIHEDQLNSLNAELHNRGNKGFAMICDMANEQQVNEFVLKTIEHFGCVDIVVNNAGILDDFMPVHALDTALWKKVIDVNLNGPFYMCRAVLSYMRQEKHGVIINISSVGGFEGCRAGAAYTASKHGLIGLSKNIAFMYAAEGIRCNVIAPGGVSTSIAKNSKPDKFGYDRAVSGSNNMPRMGDAVEIAHVVKFLASDDSSYMNGATVVVDGGWTAY